MKFFRQAVRGCKNLPHVGPHPGTDWLFIFIAMGAIAGLRGGVYGAIGGASFMAVFMVPIYLHGAYLRACNSDRIAAAPSTQPQGDGK